MSNARAIITQEEALRMKEELERLKEAQARQPRTLRDYHRPRVEDAQGPIVLPEIDGEPPNFGPAVIHLVQQNCFHGLDSENPHDHIDIFFQCCRAVKNIRASPDYVRLALFPFSLRDKAKD